MTERLKIDQSAMKIGKTTNIPTNHTRITKITWDSLVNNMKISEVSHDGLVLLLM